jgi:hypothetical protein
MTTLTAPRPDDGPDRTPDGLGDVEDVDHPGGIDDRGRPGRAPAVTDDASCDGPGAGRSRRIPRPGGPRDGGMATAEYAVATLAAVGFAGLLLTVLRSGEVQEMLLDLVRRALAVAG